MENSFSESCRLIVSKFDDWKSVRSGINGLNYPHGYKYVSEKIRRALWIVDLLDKKRPKNEDHNRSELRSLLEDQIPSAFMKYIEENTNK